MPEVGKCFDRQYMAMQCVWCDKRSLDVGVLCQACVALLPASEGLLPEHVVGVPDLASPAKGWLVDPWGFAHKLIAAKTRVGRGPEAGISVLSASVSRDHAEIAYSGSGWQVRDMGSRNGTMVDGAAVAGRASLSSGSVVSFGDVRFAFFDETVHMPKVSGQSLETVQAGSGTPLRYELVGSAGELVVLCGRDSDTVGAAGALLFRAAGQADWTEAALPPLEFALLTQLCERAHAETDSPSQARGCIATKVLARSLPFQSRFANEENVRQVVRRLRTSLSKLGITELVQSIPGRGYYSAWSVSRS